MLHMERSLDTYKNVSGIPLKFLNVVLEKDGEDQSDRYGEKCESIA